MSPKEGEKKKKFAVCVKGLDFPSEDISVRLVEWIEMLNILGADKVTNNNLLSPVIAALSAPETRPLIVPAIN